MVDVILDSVYFCALCVCVCGFGTDTMDTLRQRVITKDKSVSNGTETKSAVNDDGIHDDDKTAVQRPAFRRAFSMTLRFAVLIFLAIYAVVPGLLYISPTLQQNLIFLTFVRWPLYIDLENPAKLGLPATCNFYLNSKDGIALGTWHVLPANLQVDKQPLSTKTCEDSLQNSNPVILYLHGNSGTRGGSHRVELYKVLRQLNYHVIAFDYRGYADSSSVSPHEDGVVADATFMYKWLKERTEAPIIVWGHSLGTGVATKMVKQLCNDENEPSGLVLESPFNNLRDELRNHPLAIFYRQMPFWDSIVLSSFEKTIEFSSDKSISDIHIPLLMLHAEDDRVIPMHLALKLYNAALKSRRRAATEIAFHKFSADRNYGHKYICRAPELPQIVENFVSKFSTPSEHSSSIDIANA